MAHDVSKNRVAAAELSALLFSIIGVSDHHIGYLYDPKRSGSKGFHEGVFDQGFGGFTTMKKRGKRQSRSSKLLMAAKRQPEMTSRGIHGDAFTGDAGHAVTS